MSSTLKKTSLRTIVIGGVAAGLLIPMSIGTFYAMKSQGQRLYQETKAAHSRATNVLSLGVSKALWDLSPEAATPLVESILEDSRIVGAKVFDGQGNIFHEKKYPEREVGEVVTLEKDVLNGTDKIGKVIVDFSMASAAEQIRNKMLEAVILAVLQAMACITILILLINRRLLGPINLLKNQAGLIAKKSLDQPFHWVARDEIGELGSSLETTRGALKDLFAELEQKNADLAAINGNLEHLVAERTATIKMILDHVKSGFLLVDRNLTILDGYTRSCETLLDSERLAGRDFCSALQLNQDRSVYFKACIDQVLDDFLPEEVSLVQVPKRFKIGAHSISVEGSTVRDSKGVIDKILFTIVDITALETVEAENKANRAIVRILQNLTSFYDFVNESNTRMKQALASLKKGDEPVVRRELHTLKGNSAAFGLETVSSLIHRIEDQTLISDESISLIKSEFSNFLNRNYELFKMRFGEEAERKYTLSSHDIEQLTEQVNTAHTIEQTKHALLNWIGNIQKVTVTDMLGPIEEYIQKIARDCNRKLDFQVVGGNIKVERSELRDVVQNLIHLIRNAVDHGIELPEDRGEKSPTGMIRLIFEDYQDALTIKVQDDGGGINVERVKNKALELSLISPEKVKELSEPELVNLIFLDGLSTASRVSDISGRGVGMKAILEAIRSRSGEIKIDTKLGQGTTFTITIPHRKSQMQMAA